LEQKMILAAPIVDKSGNTIGIIDVLDIARYILASYAKDISQDLDSITSEEIKRLIEIGKVFDETPIIDVFNFVHKKKRVGIPVVIPSTTVQELLDIFSHGIHRVLVINGEGNYENLITQTDVLLLIGQFLPLLPQVIRKKTVGQMNLLTTKIKTASKTQSVVQIMSDLKEDNDFVPAVPVVDTNGTLIATFSASNLKGISKGTFTQLLFPILEFLGQQDNTKPFQVAIQHQKSLHPVTCTASNTWEEVIRLLIVNRIHRVWLVDNLNKPVGVVSIGDILRSLKEYQDS
jgi:CBS domain-containing protein